MFIGFDAAFNSALWDGMNTLVITMTLISNCFMQMDKDVYESKAPPQSPPLWQEYSHHVVLTWK